MLCIYSFFFNSLFLGAKQAASEAQTTIKTSDMELRHCRNSLKQKESENQNNDAAYNKDKKLREFS